MKRKTNSQKKSALNRSGRRNKRKLKVARKMIERRDKVIKDKIKAREKQEGELRKILNSREV